MIVKSRYESETVTKIINIMSILPILCTNELFSLMSNYCTPMSPLIFRYSSLNLKTQKKKKSWQKKISSIVWRKSPLAPDHPCPRFQDPLSKSWNYSNSIHFPRSYVIWCVVPDTWKEKKSREQLSSVLHLKQMFLLTARLHSNYKILIFSSLLSLSFESSLPKRTRNMKFNFVLRGTSPSLLPQLPLGSFIIDWMKREKNRRNREKNPSED